MLRVAVAGVGGRMGRLACATVAAADDLVLVGGLAKNRAGEALASLVALDRDVGRVYDDIAALCVELRPDVLLDFTVYPDTVRVARTAVEHAVAAVVGTTGWSAQDLEDLADVCLRRGVPACVVPNFALGAVLMMRFAEDAARFFPTVEIVELHHDQKRDAPSGTARLTAQRLAAAREGQAVPIHSVRLRGLVAHQEVLFGGTGELLTIRHDALSRDCFAAGMLLAVRGVQARTGLTVGLDAFLA